MNNESKISSWLKDISRDGNEQSFRCLFDHFYPQLFSLACYYTKSHQIAEEVICDVFTKVWSRRKKLSDINDIRRYFCVAVKRQSLNAIRNQSKNIIYLDTLQSEVLITQKSPIQNLLEKEFIEYLQSVIQKLPEKCRLVFLMVKEQEMKYAEVAQSLDISVKTVEMHMSSALKRIREALVDYQKQPQSNNISNTLAVAAFICLFI